MARVWNLQGPALDRWQRIVEGSEIERRHAVMPADEAVGLTTAQRMNAYERFAAPLAETAARRALAHASVTSAEITDVVIVSCTGLSAPGVDVALVERLGLSPTTRRTTIGFMGCFGAINGLRVASGLCAADPASITIVVCVELCSLHMRAESDVQNLVASALFADGAAAAVVVGRKAARALAAPQNLGLREVCLDGPLSNGARLPAHLAPARLESRTERAVACLGHGSSLLLPEGREWMTWRITDAGFAMTLSREVPVALRNTIAGFVREAGAPDDATFIVHPGGPGVLDAVDDALELRGAAGIECSRDILRRFGNMSSGTVLFVLEQALGRGHAPPALMLAFGPGLTIEGLVLDSLQPAAEAENV